MTQKICIKFCVNVSKFILDVASSVKGKRDFSSGANSIFREGRNIFIRGRIVPPKKILPGGITDKRGNRIAYHN